MEVGIADAPRVVPLCPQLNARTLGALRRTTMRRRHSVLVVFVVLVLSVLSSSLGYSQEQKNNNSLEAGAWSLQFKITDNFSLSTFTGSLVSLKRHFSPRSALRVGIGLSALQTDSEGEFSDPDTVFTDVGESSFTGVQVDLQYVRYTNPESRGSLFWGIGPTFQYSKSDAMIDYGGDTVDSRRRRWSIGIIASLGVEWFPTKVIGIHAEYGLQGLYSSMTDDSERTNSTESSRHRDSTFWTVSGQSVLLGLSVYF
jgi:hypothetical protein